MSAEILPQVNKRETIDEDQQVKRRRVHSSSSSSSFSDDDDDGSSTILSNDNVEKSGKIKRIYMQNFMCFDAKEIVFNPRINYIVGANGSGKSAIVAALTIGLGARTSAACRYSSIEEFIKIGKDRALIEITISNNDGNSAYKYDVYGNSITVVRIIGINHGYKIKNWSGEVVSTKEDELDEIVKSLNIQVNNPISVVNEDVARSFLSSFGPEEKYRLFIETTLLSKISILKEINTNCDSKGTQIIFEENEKKMTLLLQQNFTEIIALRNYQGGITVDHSKHLLNVEFSPENGAIKLPGDVKALSGGERAYATLAFILAMWNVTSIPFYFLDTFDVFMDKIQRRVITEILLNHAQCNPECQFVFLTHLDIPYSHIQAENLITIHRL